MSSNIFLISDTHFGHEKCCTVFKRQDGSPLRPFANAQEMDEEMVRRWNEVVREQDKVYHLGDVVISKRFLDIIGRLNGSKRLIRGNHDIFKTKEYIEAGFKEIYGVRVLEKVNAVLTHVPLHPASITERWGVNIHGHLHANIVERMVTIHSNPGAGALGYDDVLIPDGLYESACVEQIDYRPIELSELLERNRLKRETYGVINYGEYTHRK